MDGVYWYIPPILISTLMLIYEQPHECYTDQHMKINTHKQLDKLINWGTRKTTYSMTSIFLLVNTPSRLEMINLACRCAQRFYCQHWDWVVSILDSPFSILFLGSRSQVPGPRSQVPSPRSQVPSPKSQVPSPSPSRLTIN